MSEKTNTSSEKNLRPPVVSVLGHVDHGKTTLLDAIRKTSVAKKEAGGITQKIGASVVETKDGKEITFIDTPGHAAFSKMRSRGANAADIVILVVAADDGVKPQTKEAIEHIKKAEVPYIVALTKTDLPGANIEQAKGQLEKEGVLFEGRGGDVPVVSVSAKEDKGINDLLEMINLVSEVNEIKGDPKASLQAIVIETGKEKQGNVVSVVVKDGSLHVGDEIFVEAEKAKVRGLFDWEEERIKEVYPGFPAQILGFGFLPPVGSVVTGKKNGEMKTSQKKREVKEVKEGEIPVVIKAQSKGSLEAVLSNLPEKIIVVDSGVGDVAESDVFMAKAASARIFVFESKASSSVKKLAETERVKIEQFNIIYELFDRLEELLKEKELKTEGEAEVVDIFPFNKKKVAGCKVKKGRIIKANPLLVMRNGEKIKKVKIISMKKQKQDIEEAKEGEECGIIFVPQLDFKVGDVLVSLSKKQ